MKTTTTITRDSNYSFVKEITKENGESFFRKLEKGTTEYSNACMEFNMKNIELTIGSKIVKTN